MLKALLAAAAAISVAVGPLAAGAAAAASSTPPVGATLLGRGSVDEAWLTGASPGDHIVLKQRGVTVSNPANPAPADSLGTLIIRNLTPGPDYAWFDTTTGLQITSVAPQVGPALRRGSSDYRLTALGAHGKVLARVAMLEAGGHFDGLGPFVELQGKVPAAGVLSVRITSPTGAVATRTRPAKAPAVRVLAPGRAITRVGGTRPVVLKWVSTNPAHLGLLTATIDYSANGGRNWRTIWIGGNTGHVSLPSFYFARSRDAMVRVRVNDGFNETPATSPRFAALDPPPEVSILAPDIAASTPIAGDALLQLTGTAWDAQLTGLGGTRLRWYDGRTLLGTGGSLLAGPLPPGANKISLVARDSTGKTAVTTTTVDVRKVPLPFLNLHIPTSISAASRSLAITATSGLAGMLGVDGRRLQLAPGLAGRLTLPVRPGATPLVLRMAITADGIRVPFAVRVRR